MQSADIAIILIVVVSALVGLVRGFLREAVAILAWIIAVLVAWHAGPSLEPHLGGLLAGPEVRPWAARAILMILVLVIGAGIGAVLGEFVRLSIFGAIDRFFGLVFGVLRGLVILGVLAIICQTLRLDGERWWHKATLAPLAEAVGSGLRSLAGDAERQERRHRNLAVANSAR
jgi:membrane protein required for colicin V production